MTITNRKQRRSFLKRSLSFLLVIVFILNIGIIQGFATGTDAPIEPGTYTVPISSLVSKAPLPAIQAAFAGAFGDSAEVTIDEEGKMTALIRAQHMKINFMGEYHANVMTIEGATYHSYQTVLSSTTFGDTSKIEEIQAPDEISFPLPQADGNGSFVLTLTVDFMDSFLGGGNPYPTDVTLALDFENAQPDTTELSNLIASYQALEEESYTADTWSALQEVLAQAKTMLENGASMADINAMIVQLNMAKDNLEWEGANYSKVEAALAKIPGDSSIYTEESWNALMIAKNAVQNGLRIERQEEVDAYAADIEGKIAILVYKNADYAQVDKAIASVPKDLSKYTEQSVKKLQDALDGVTLDLKANEQARIDKMASNIEAAVKGLTEKSISSDTDKDTSSDTDTSGNTGNDTSKVTDGPLDKENLADGIYTVSIQLWHATNDSSSMAAGSFQKTGRIVVENGVSTMYVYTKPMTFGSITASLQEMKIADLNGNYVMAKVENKDAFGNPTAFSFGLPHTQEYIIVQVNPHIEMMGNQFLDARILVDYTSLKKLSDDSDDISIDLTKADASETNASETETKEGNTANPKTGDSSNVIIYSLLALDSASIILWLMYSKKRRANTNE